MDYRIKERILKNMLVEITNKYDYILGDYKALESQYRERLFKDYLTGTLNREGFINELKEIHSKCESDRVYYGVIMIDLDNFKFINSFYGHEIGDLFLKKVADILSSSLPSTSTIGRIGGDEFAVVVYDINEDMLIDISSNIKNGIESFRFMVGDSFITTTASIGISFNNSCKLYSKVFEEAANALAESKKKGKNIITFYDSLLQQKSEKLMDGKNLILKALFLEDSVIPFIQPIVRTDTRGIIGGEFLMRIKIEDTIFTPFHFLEAGVYFGLIDKLESLMLNSVLNLDFRKDLMFFLNKTIRKEEKLKDIVGDSEFLEKLTYEKGINFVVEITEDSIFENIDAVKEMMYKSRGKEIQFAIDDFGSGYTSLRYLYDLDISYIKIDGHLIKGINTQPKIKSILEGIVSISKSLGIKTIAEYVESEEEYKFCLDIGVDFCQGYYFYKPMEVREFIRLTG